MVQAINTNGSDYKVLATKDGADFPDLVLIGDYLYISDWTSGSVNLNYLLVYV